MVAAIVGPSDGPVFLNSHECPSRREVSTNNKVLLYLQFASRTRKVRLNLSPSSLRKASFFEELDSEFLKYLIRGCRHGDVAKVPSSIDGEKFCVRWAVF